MERVNSKSKPPTLKLIGENLRFSDSNFKKYERIDGRKIESIHCPASNSSAVKSLTSDIVYFFKECNPSFKYAESLNPRRVLTKPSESVSNDSYDNVNAEYILYVNDIIGSYSKHQYQILDLLGQGTFGQVVKSMNIDSKELVAIKIVKNKPAYFNQGLVEIQILEMLNHQFDADNQHHLLRLLDYFVFRNHLCLVFELMSVNLYELIKQNQFRGLSMTLLRCFMLQALDALTIMQKAHVIHCDLKPENILLENLTSPSIKIIDFGSACLENQTVYTYIQSRFYRSPEVLIGVKYTSSIDMWSLGCIAAELFLGLPLFPGSSEYNQLFRIVDMLGPLPNEILDQGSKSSKFYNQSNNNVFTLKTEDQYAMENGIEVQPSKKYFKFKTLSEIIDNYAIKEGLKPHEVQKERELRKSFADFLLGLLQLNPEQRWTAEQAQRHPFITGEEFKEPFVPAPSIGMNIRTPPRVIPWGIQNSAHLSRPQDNAFNSMSYQDNFVVGSEPTPYSHSLLFSSSLSNSFSNSGGLGHMNTSGSQLHPFTPLTMNPNTTPISSHGFVPVNTTGTTSNSSPRLNRSPSSVRSHSPGMSIAIGGINVNVNVGTGMDSAPVGVLAASADGRSHYLAAAAAGLSPRGPNPNAHQYHGSPMSVHQRGGTGGGNSATMSPRHHKEQQSPHYHKEQQSTHYHKDQQSSLKGRQRSKSDISNHSPQQQNAQHSQTSHKNTSNQGSPFDKKAQQSRWQQADKKGERSPNNNQGSSFTGSSAEVTRDSTREQQGGNRRRAKSFGGKNQSAPNNNQNPSSSSGNLPNDHNKSNRGGHNNFQQFRGRKRSPSTNHPGYNNPTDNSRFNTSSSLPANSTSSSGISINSGRHNNTYSSTPNSVSSTGSYLSPSPDSLYEQQMLSTTPISKSGVSYQNSPNTNASPGSAMQFPSIGTSDSGGHVNQWNDDLLFDIETEQVNSGNNNNMGVGNMATYPPNDLYMGMASMHISNPNTSNTSANVTSGNSSMYYGNFNGNFNPSYSYGGSQNQQFPYPAIPSHMSMQHNLSSSPSSNPDNSPLSSSPYQMHHMYHMQQQHPSQMPHVYNQHPFVSYQDNTRGTS